MTRGTEYDIIDIVLNAFLTRVNKSMSNNSIKRRDSKGRILRDRESQNSDGRYRYSYYENGKKKSFYSWKLERHDKLPAGRRQCKSLREMEQELQLQQFQGIHQEKMTVAELVERYLTIRDVSLKKTTRTNHQTSLNLLKSEAFGQRQISSVTISETKLFFLQLQEDGKRFATIRSLRGIMRPAFQMAVDDNLILKNPIDFPLCTVVINDSVTREAITPDQMRRFLKFVQGDEHFSMYYEGFYILFYTGMRISEFCGLTLKDINMQERKISIDHQLIRWSDMQYGIETTKTNAGTRQIPMTDGVYECFKKILANRKGRKVEPVIDGYSGFLYLDKNGRPMVGMHWEKYFQHAVDKHNKIYKDELPTITPHVCRHTYCSNQARAGMNPKTLQYLMGHSDIGVTLNTYTHLKYDDAKAEVLRMTDSRETTKKDA